MNTPPPQIQALSVAIDPEKCNGCVVCIRACPARAIRIRGDKAVILEDRCIDCGECIRVCPNDAVVPMVSTFSDMARFKVKAVLPSPVMYTQFGEDVLPNEVLLALTKMGFDYVFDLARYCEWGNLAVFDWLRRHPDVRTAIATTCPVVTRLIAKRFPGLIGNIVAVKPPREFGAAHVRNLLKRKLGLADADIGVFHITPCAAKIVDINFPMTMSASSLDGALGMSSLYGEVQKSLKAVDGEDRETILFQAGGFGIDWDAGGLGGEERTLSVSGLSDTLDVLEQIEAGRLADVRYVDCRVCQDGCLGGPLTVENRYLARVTLRNLVRMFGSVPRVRMKDIRRLIKDGFFDPDNVIRPILHPLDNNPVVAMKKLQKVDDLTARLPGKQCAICGAPDCRTLAEDVVQGQADLFVCPLFFRLRTWGRRTMILAEIVEKLGLEVLTGDDALNREVTGVYAGDLLSDVMANSRNGQLWVTMQGHINVIAVAALKEISAVVLVNERDLAEDALARAREEGIPVLRTDISAYELSGRLYSLLAG